MLKNILLVGSGGFVGSVARYLTAQWMQRWANTGFPIGTLAVNILGCLLLGLLLGIAERSGQVWRMLLVVGFCGGFTTFSAFAGENFQLLRSNQTGHFLLYSSASLGLGLLAVWLGHALAR